MEDDVEVELIPAPDDPEVSSPEYQAGLTALTAPLHAAGIRFTQRAIAYDSVDVHGFPLGEFVVPLATVAGSVFGTAIVAWLQGRAGRKVRLKVGDIEAEARTTEEIEQLLAKAAELKAKSDQDGKS